MTGQERPEGPPVLLVEDEPLLIMVLSDYIEEAGGTVVHAATTAEAIRTLEARADIRVVLADLDVRGSVMGLRLAALIRDRWPPIELVLTGAVRPERALIPARGVFHDKPFEQRKVIGSLRGFIAGA